MPAMPRGSRCSASLSNAASVSKLRNRRTADDQTTLFSSRRFTHHPTALTGDSESEFGSAGQSPLPVEPLRRGGMESYQPRPFNAWASAREQDGGPSIWARARERIARLFSRRASTESVEDLESESESKPESETRSDELDEVGLQVNDPVAPPTDFQFPWTRPESVSALPPTSGFDDGHAVDDAASEVSDSEAELPFLEGTFSSVDEALPRSGDARGIDEEVDFAPGTEADTDPIPEAAEQESTQEVPRPPGLFARLLRLRRGDAVVESPEAERKSDEINPVFLVSKFRTFYNEILTQKHQGSDITSGFATAIVTADAQDETPDVNADQAAQALSARLMQMLELQHAEATWMGGETAARYPDAQYAMAVLADETLSTLEWKGRSAWPQHSLEMRLYKSKAADLEFFRRVDRLFKERQPTPAARDLARVYLLTIAAGFRGKYGLFGLSRALHEYRQRLYEFVYDGDALLLYADDRQLFPDAGSRTIAGKAMSRFSGAQRWVAVLVAVMIGYTVLAHIAWNRASADLRDVTARVEATKAVGAR